MKLIGSLLILLGLGWGFMAFNMDTSVETQAQYVAGTYVPSQRVNNLGKMDERRNHLLAAATILIMGTILVAVGALKGSGNQAPSGMSTGAKVGIGAAVGLVALLGGTYLLGRYRVSSSPEHRRFEELKKILSDHQREYARLEMKLVSSKTEGEREAVKREIKALQAKMEKDSREAMEAK